MATKQDPGARDFYAELEPDEPFILFRARDVTTPMMGRIWAMIRQQGVNIGAYPESDRDQVKDMLGVVTDCEIWHREHRTKQQMATLAFDNAGVPTTGQHAKKDKNSTSGAND